MRIVGLILAGGRSRRFGSEKAAQLLGGRPLLAWGLACLDEVCEAVAVSAAPASAAWRLATTLGREALADDPDHPSGPLSGLAAGLAWAGARGADLLATLPCDTPLVTAAHFATLAARLGEAPAAHAATPGGEQWLCAVWRPHLLPSLTARLDRQDHPAVGAYLQNVGAKAVTFKDDDAFANVNFEADLARMRNRELQ